MEKADCFRIAELLAPCAKIIFLGFRGVAERFCYYRRHVLCVGILCDFGLTLFRPRHSREAYVACAACHVAHGAQVGRLCDITALCRVIIIFAIVLPVRTPVGTVIALLDFKRARPCTVRNNLPAIACKHTGAYAFAAVSPLHRHFLRLYVMLEHNMCANACRSKRILFSSQRNSPRLF